MAAPLDVCYPPPDMLRSLRSCGEGCWMAVEFKLLGDMEARVDGRRLEIGHARQRCVLVAFLIDVNRPIPVDQLVDRVWSDRPPHHARNSLAGYVSRLRNLLAGTENTVISREPGGYVLAADPLTVDLYRFRSVVAQARASADPDEAAGLFDRALAIWSGEPFVSLDTPWINDIRGALQAERFSVELDRNDVALRVGRHAELLVEISAAQAANPLDERLAGQLMLAQFRNGRQADSLDTYRRIRERLVEELGVDPGSGLRQLHQHILTGEAEGQAAHPVSRVAAPPHPRVFERLHSGLLRRPTSLVGHQRELGRGRRLPSTVTTFVGRDAEVTQLQELLSVSRLVTVTGVGGVGKTTLAAHTAAKLRQQFTDGAWWVDLAELREGALLTEVVAAALGVRDQLGRALTEVLVDFLGQRQSLVVLDNCEHLIDDVANLAETLLRDCPQLQMLATSREVLDIGGEAVLRLDPLSCPTLGEDPTLGSVAGYAAVQLFVQRARAVVPGFELDVHNATAIARSCARLDGLPLAIELAAARTRVMSAEQIAEELADRFGFLSHGHRGAPTRRQSLMACLDWSYDLCTQSEQRLWRRLSVLVESFDLATARGICGEDVPADEFLDLLSALVDKSILIRTEHHGVVCFRLLETLRDFGNSHTTEAEHLRLARRHAAWYHQLLAEAEAQWFGPQQLQWIERLTRDLPNIREALQFSLTDNPVMAVDMTVAMRQFWLCYAVLSEGCRWASRALDATSPEPSVQRMRALFTVALLTIHHGDMVTGMSWLAEARSLFEVVEDPDTRGRIHFYDAYIALMTGNIDHVQDHLEQAMAATDDFEVQVYSMGAMSWLDIISGDPHGALAWSDKSLALAQSRGDWVMRVAALGTVGAAHWRLGDLQRAEQFLYQCLQLGLEVSNQYEVANGLELLAWITETRNQPRQAAVLMAAAAEISRASGAILASVLVGDFHSECERRVREQLSAAEFQAAWNEGTALNMSDIAEVISPGSR
ncbi:BTAD domain-containing putative transcriptional regulator [Mycobacterium simulans]|nr:BTAD domain-containing putative transcriptional regulator [Mycobacterium simulans]